MSVFFKEIMNVFNKSYLYIIFSFASGQKSSSPHPGEYSATPGLWLFRSGKNQSQKISPDWSRAVTACVPGSIILSSNGPWKDNSWKAKNTDGYLKLVVLRIENHMSSVKNVTIIHYFCVIVWRCTHWLGISWGLRSQRILSCCCLWEFTALSMELLKTGKGNSTGFCTVHQYSLNTFTWHLRKSNYWVNPTYDWVFEMLVYT